MTVTADDFVFETGRLCMHPLGAGDEAMFCGLYTDASTMRFIGPPLTPEHAARSFSKTLALMNRQPLAALYLAILEKATGQRIGICGVPKFDAAATSLEIGVMLLRSARGAGFAKEAKTGLMRRLFALLPVDEIRVEYQRGNAAAERSNLSIGFSPEVGVAMSSDDAGTRRMSAHRRTWRDITA